MSDLRDPLEAERLVTEAPEAFHTQRDFLKRTAVTAGLTASMGLVLDPGTLVAEAAPRQREVALPSPRNLPIDTFVVLMMENRSFDHTSAGCRAPTGARPACSSPTSRASLTPPTASPPTSRAAGSWIPTIRGRAGAPSSTADAWTAFSRRPATCSRSATTPAMTCPSPLMSRRRTRPLTAFSARCCPRPIPTASTCTPPLWGSAGLSRSSQIQNFYERAAAGTLPALSFVDPAFNGEDQGTSGDEHPHGDVRVGQAFVADVVHAFMESPQFQRGALFIVYDEWGGFFDHVVPPRVPDLRTSRDLSKDFGQMGFRIPAVTVSPYARRGHVEHSIYGFESILKMIRYRCGLPPLTPRDLYANNIAAAFDFEHPDTTLRALPSPPTVIASACGAPVPAPVIGTPLPDVPKLPIAGHAHHPVRGQLAVPAPQRAKPHDLQALVTSGYLERLGFDYRPATPATMFRHHAPHAPAREAAGHGHHPRRCGRARHRLGPDADADQARARVRRGLPAHARRHAD